MADASANILLNGSPRALPRALTVGELVAELGLPRERVAVELNGAVVRKADYDGVRIEPGAKVEVFSFVGGG